MKQSTTFCTYAQTSDPFSLGDAKSQVRWKLNWQSRPHFCDRFIFSFDISLHNKRCEGEFLECILRIFADRAPVEISLGDTLQRINYSSYGHPEIGLLDSSRAKSIAEKEGDGWLARNQSIISSVLGDSGAKIVRWSEWEKNDRVEFYKSHLFDLLNADSVLRDALGKDIARYERYWKVQPSQRVTSGFGEYVVEEVAVYAAQAERALYVHVYPGACLNFLRALRTCEIALPCVRYHDHIYLYLRS